MINIKTEYLFNRYSNLPNFGKAFLLCLSIIVLLNIKLQAQISPGELTKAHAKYEGLSNCTKCHQLGKQVQESKCLNCHKEIKTLIDNSIGYHSSVEVKKQKCWKCHSEHHGRNFEIIHFNKNKFDHNKTGFKLQGKHAKTKCEDCHKDKFISDKKFKRRKSTYLGLSTKCASCHEDVHQKTLGTDCASCHNTEKFKPASLFNHNSAKFKLSGAHKNVKCIKCHIKETMNGKKFQKFTGLSFHNCTPCHTDVHKGKFGNNCTKCHDDVSFKKLRRSSFDHSKTRFPLKGAHENVKCANCHGKNLLSKPKFAKCIDCHKDKHFGEFTVNNVLIDCQECLSINSFKVTEFTIQEHDKGNFKLTGAHLAVPCQMCHFNKQNKNEWHFKKIGVKCIDCHKDIHGSEISKKFMPNRNCSSCHSTDTWKKISFNHDLTTFKLEGKHKQVRCEDCHSGKTRSSKIKFIFASLKSNCKTCHRDIHFGQFDSEKKGNQPVCENCHGFSSWKAKKFDHEKTQFPLKGAHEKLLCTSCHKKVTENGNQFIKYKLRDIKCASCHSS